MNITDVRVRRVAKEGKMKAVVSITIDEEFVVHDIKVIEGEKGLFIAMPSRKATDGEYRDIAHPINSATRERIQNIILEKYEQVLAEEPLEEAAEEEGKRKKALGPEMVWGFFYVRKEELPHLTPAGWIFVFQSAAHSLSPSKRETVSTYQLPTVLGRGFCFGKKQSFSF